MRPDAVRGALIGQCLGDALGFPVEGHDHDSCRSYVDEVLRAGRAGALGRPPFPFGQYTDDSQLARELARSIVARGRFEPADYAGRIAALFAEGRVVGRGRATEEAARRLSAGVPWDEAGAPPPVAGNGSAMRAAPIGLLHAADDRRLVADAVDQSRITHADGRCCAGSVAVAAAVAAAPGEEALEVERFVARLATLIAPVDEGFASEVRRLPAWVGRHAADVVEEIAGAGGGGDSGWRHISPFVVPSVLWSLYAFLRTPDDYWATICTAIWAGGDVDTTAAMAGAISGARVGLAGLPGPLAERLTDRGRWGVAALVELADALAATARRAAT